MLEVRNSSIHRMPFVGVKDFSPLSALPTYFNICDHATVDLSRRILLQLRFVLLVRLSWCDSSLLHNLVANAREHELVRVPARRLDLVVLSNQVKTFGLENGTISSIR